MIVGLDLVPFPTCDFQCNQLSPDVTLGDVGLVHATTFNKLRLYVNTKLKLKATDNLSSDVLDMPAQKEPSNYEIKLYESESKASSQDDHDEEPGEPVRLPQTSTPQQKPAWLQIVNVSFEDIENIDIIFREAQSEDGNRHELDKRAPVDDLNPLSIDINLLDEDTDGIIFDSAGTGTSGVVDGGSRRVRQNTTFSCGGRLRAQMSGIDGAGRPHIQLWSDVDSRC